MASPLRLPLPPRVKARPAPLTPPFADTRTLIVTRSPSVVGPLLRGRELIRAPPLIPPVTTGDTVDDLIPVVAVAQRSADQGPSSTARPVIRPRRICRQGRKTRAAVAGIVVAVSRPRPLTRRVITIGIALRPLTVVARTA